MAGDYVTKLRQYGDQSFDYDLATGTAGPVTLFTVRNSAYRIYVQKISVSVVTFAAKTLTFQDSAGSPVVIAVDSIPAAETATPGDQTWSQDFGPDGTALSVGKNLVLALSAAGAAARIHVQLYQRYDGSVVLNAQSGNQ